VPAGGWTVKRPCHAMRSVQFPHCSEQPHFNSSLNLTWHNRTRVILLLHILHCLCKTYITSAKLCRHRLLVTIGIICVAALRIHRAHVHTFINNLCDGCLAGNPPPVSAILSSHTSCAHPVRLLPSRPPCYQSTGLFNMQVTTAGRLKANKMQARWDNNMQSTLIG
jgi:hypothetical protein